MQFTWKFSHSCRFGFSAVLNSTSRGNQNTAFLWVPGTKGTSVLLLAKKWEMTSGCLFCCSNPFFSAEKGKGMNCLELTGSQQLRRVTPLQQVEENERSHFRHSLASECLHYMRVSTEELTRVRKGQCCFSLKKDKRADKMTH